MDKREVEGHQSLPVGHLLGHSPHVAGHTETNTGLFAQESAILANSVAHTGGSGTPSHFGAVVVEVESVVVLLTVVLLVVEDGVVTDVCVVTLDTVLVTVAVVRVVATHESQSTGHSP